MPDDAQSVNESSDLQNIPPVEETPDVDLTVKEEQNTNPPEQVSTIQPPPVPSMTTSQKIPTTRKKISFARFLLNILLFVLLFGLGVWLSGTLRGVLFPPEEEVIPERLLSVTPTSSVLPSISPTPSSNAWKTYLVRNNTKLSYQLPAEVLDPVCDGTACLSQGTYLPGGTRFTVAARGTGMPLADFRGAVITDASGRKFETKETNIAGKTTLDYQGNFIGTTVAGYTFTQMHGVMIAVTETLSLEVNHFAPRGINADFTADEALFLEILQTINFNQLPLPDQEKGIEITPSP